MDLYYPPRPKSKLEEYNLKLKERELYTNNILDRFTENGNGSPLKDEKGNLFDKRKAILEKSKNFENDFSKSQQVNTDERKNLQLNYSNNIDYNTESIRIPKNQTKNEI